jgi:hypothetical protein
MLIGCLRPAEAAHQENLATMDYLNRLDVLSDPSALPKEGVPLEQCKSPLHFTSPIS